MFKKDNKLKTYVYIIHLQTGGYAFAHVQLYGCGDDRLGHHEDVLHANQNHQVREHLAVHNAGKTRVN